MFVYLIRPPNILPVTSHQSQQGVPPLGMAYIAAALKASGFQYACLDAVGERIGSYFNFGYSNLLGHGLTTAEIIDRIPEKTTIVGISCMFANEWLHTKTIVIELKKKFPHITVVLGGEYANADARYILEKYPEISVCVRGEGEETFISLLNAFKKSEDLSTVLGIVYRDDSGQVITTAPRSRIKKLDDIAWPDWESIPLEEYLKRGRGNDTQKKRSIPMIASRGCPFKCTFCSNPQMWTTKWNSRCPADVVEEIKFYIRRYNIEHFEFYDLTVVIDPRWILEFCSLLIKEKIVLTWSIPSGTRSESLTFEVLQALKNSGCHKITLAPESGSPETLKRIIKKVNPVKMLKVIKMCSDLGIISRCNMIFGLPDQTIKEVLESFGFLFKAAWYGSTDVACFTFVPYPGSQLFDELIANGTIKRDENYEFNLANNIISNLGNLKSYSKYIKDWQQPLCVLGGMFFFYFFSFMFRPKRLLELVIRVLSRKPLTMLEMVLDGLFENFILGRKTKSVLATDLLKLRHNER